MLEETYDKFKLQLQASKAEKADVPEIVMPTPEQVHRICSYNHYPVKEMDTTKSGLQHNDIYDIKDVTHELEYGIYEDIFKSEQLMAELKEIDDIENVKQQQFADEYDDFPLNMFHEAGCVDNHNDKQLQTVADTELYQLDQQITDNLVDQPHNGTDPVHYTNDSVSHMQKQVDENQHVYAANFPVYVPYNDEKQ
ncbi:MAG: hypothetical protein MJE68_18315, partial [Proteobacteria bacterium]|nr:hypothetical protein [Pseudomonadota bacterium]